MDTTKILITAGVGDFLTLDAFITEEEREAVREIYFAARGRYGIEAIIDAAPVFPNLKKITIVWDKWGDSENPQPGSAFGFRNKAHLIQGNIDLGWGLNLSLLDDVVDFCVFDIFPEILAGNRIFNGGTLFRYQFADTSKFKLPEEYGVINPYSASDKHFGNRDFNKWEWKGVIRYLERTQQKAVVINCTDDEIPEHELLINLNHQTTVPEAVEIAKHCSFYVGIDSWLSVIATRFLDADSLLIKSENGHYYSCLPIYCAPHKSFPFVRLSFKDLW